MDLSNKKIHLFINNTIWYDLKIWHNITSWTKLNYFKYICTLKLVTYTATVECLFRFIFGNSKALIFAIMSSFFFIVKRRLLFGKLGKTKQLLFTFEKKIYIKIWTHTFLWDFFLLWIWNCCKQRDEKKIKIQYVFEKSLFKAIIVFTSIYFESYCKIPARSNTLILWSFYYDIYLHVKGILNQNKQIYYLACAWGRRPMLEAKLTPEC